MQPLYGHLIRVLSNHAELATTSALASMDLTAAQGHIMGFITHRKSAPCARDIEEFFHLSHPTVSGILSRLEQKEFIELRPDPVDRRCKRIYSTDKGLQLHETMNRTIQTMETQLVQDFTPEEQALFSHLLQRAIDNLGGHPCKRKQKEEFHP